MKPPLLYPVTSLAAVMSLTTVWLFPSWTCVCASLTLNAQEVFLCEIFAYFHQESQTEYVVTNFDINVKLSDWAVTNLHVP